MDRWSPESGTRWIEFCWWDWRGRRFKKIRYEEENQKTQKRKETSSLISGTIVVK